MNATGIFLSQYHLAQLSPSAREEVQRIVFGGREETEADADPLKWLLGKSTPADLNHEQAKALVAGLSPQSINYLKPFLRRSLVLNQDLLEATKKQHYRELAGISSGLTKRVRTVLGDDREELVMRAWDASVPLHSRTPENARYRMSKQTIESLRAVLEGTDGSQ